MQVAERTRRSRSAAAGSGRARSQGDGGRLNRSYEGEEYREPGEGYNGEQPTKGLYTCELFDVRDHTKADDEEATSIRWGFRLTPGQENKNGDDVSGFPDFIYTTENTAWREQQMLVALGVIKPNGKVNLTYEGIIKKAKPCTVKIGMERYVPEDGSDPEWRGRMTAFLPLREGVAKPKSRRAKDEDEGVEDVFDDGDEPDDDGEDDEPEPEPAKTRRSTNRRRKAEPEPEPEDDEDEEGDDEDGEEDEPYDAEVLEAELAELTLAKLKARARDEFSVKITRGMDADKIIDAVLATLDEPDEDEDEDDEPEEEPEPPKRRSRTAAKPAASSRRRASKGSDDPPF